MKTTIMAILFTLILTTAAFAATVTLTVKPITDTTVVKLNYYYTMAAGCSFLATGAACTAAGAPSNCASLVPQTPATSVWTLVGSVAAPTNTDVISEPNSGTYCYYATASSATAESPPSNVASLIVPLAAPVLTVSQ